MAEFASNAEMKSVGLNLAMKQWREGSANREDRMCKRSKEFCVEQWPGPSCF